MIHFKRTCITSLKNQYTPPTVLNTNGNRSARDLDVDELNLLHKKIKHIVFVSMKGTEHVGYDKTEQAYY